MTKPSPHSLLEQLDSRDAETVLCALRGIDASGEIAPFLPKLVELLHTREADLRFVAANKLSEAARRGHDIQVAIPALETLSDDEAVPSWIAKLKGVKPIWTSVGWKATSAVT